MEEEIIRRYAAGRPNAQLAVVLRGKMAQLSTGWVVGSKSAELNEEVRRRPVYGETVHSGANSTPVEAKWRWSELDICRIMHGGADSTPADGAWRSALDASGGMHGGANSTPAAAVPWKVVVMLADVSETAAPVGDLPREESE